MKKYVIIVCVLSMLFTAACDRKNVNDIYSMQSESSSYEQQTSAKENKVISEGYVQCTQDDKPLLIAQGDEYTAISNGSRKKMLTFKINHNLYMECFEFLGRILQNNRWSDNKMKQMLKIELERAFRSSGFWLSLMIGMLDRKSVV